jgi:hypothetical protein
MSLMIYLSLDTNRIRAIYFKKSLLGQYDINFSEKEFQLNLIEKGQVINTDVIASAMQEVLTNLFNGQAKDKEVILILPQDTFSFLRSEIPADIAPTILNSFLRDKARSTLSIDLTEYHYDYFLTISDKQKQVSLYALANNILALYQEAFKLLDLKIANIIPDTLAYFKLFDKTLRKDKKENIFYVAYEERYLSGYLYDSYGYLGENRWQAVLTDKKDAEKLLEEKGKEYEEKSQKINRLILSGKESETVRQDTFTKKVGIWTNPIKRIITNFYQEYLKLLIAPNKSFSILSYDVCLGGFIFTMENKTFSLLKKTAFTPKVKANFNLKRIFKREYFLFAASFIASFILFTVLSKFNLQIKLPNFSNFMVAPTMTPTPSPLPPTPTPTPSFKKEDLNVNVLNGGGVAGKASEVTATLKKAGYSGTVNGGNADNFDYTQTVIQVKKTKAQAFSMLKNDLADYATNPKKETLDEKDPADVIFIIGQDFK